MRGYASLDIWPDGHSICGPIVPLDMCHNVARIGQKHIESSTVIKSIVFDLFYPIRMAGFGASALIFTPYMEGQNRGEKQGTRPFISIARKAGKYRVCLWQTYQVSRQGNISSERLGENGNFFYPSFCHGRTGCAFRHPGGAAARLPAKRANIEFPKGTYRVCRQANISSERLGENGNPFLHFIYDGRNRMCLQAPRRRCRPGVPVLSRAFLLY